MIVKLIFHTYNPSNPWVSHQALSVNGKRSGITRTDFLAVSEAMGIKKAAGIIDQGLILKTKHKNI